MKVQTHVGFEKIVDKSSYYIQGVVEENNLCIYNANYEEPPSKEEQIGIARTLETINDDAQFYKDVEDFQKSL